MLSIGMAEVDVKVQLILTNLTHPKTISLKLILYTIYVKK